MQPTSNDSEKYNSLNASESDATPLEYNKRADLGSVQQHGYDSTVDYEFQNLLQDVLFDHSNDSINLHTHSMIGPSIMFGNKALTPTRSSDVDSYKTPKAGSHSAELKCSGSTSPASKLQKPLSLQSLAEDESGLSYKELRKLRNRQAAARSRQRMQQKLRDLEKLAQDLQRKNRHLENLVYALATEKQKSGGVAIPEYAMQPNVTQPEEAYASGNAWPPFQHFQQSSTPVEHTPNYSNEGFYSVLPAEYPIDCFQQQ
uniref:AlNc14C196G8572 protein n=1 Tax=Albugo laibachii Nc14 TaxID=890382 RepID=F0WQ91_9STRA|nr:AlNc14C196G8572 [Albugo laibachii Nc14]|eukprot:CCA23497.1 AlNc14C196G8572 [Albugo laibachii Nc14]